MTKERYFLSATLPRGDGNLECKHFLHTCRGAPLGTFTEGGEMKWHLFHCNRLIIKYLLPPPNVLIIKQLRVHLKMCIALISFVAKFATSQNEKIIKRHANFKQIDFDGIKQGIKTFRRLKTQ
jgi:hypothetical protein